MTPRGYDPQRDIVACPDCGTTLEAEWVDVRTMADQYPRLILSTLSCPTSPTHDLDAAYRALEVVQVAHPNRDGVGSCVLVSLPFWRRQGWFPTDPQHQTPTEMVHARVRALSGQEE